MPGNIWLIARERRYISMLKRSTRAGAHGAFATAESVPNAFTLGTSEHLRRGISRTALASKVSACDPLSADKL
jgi:hypothetical protein